jgi:hypothetical protein
LAPKVALMPARRFPPPWTFDEANHACFIVRDGNNFPVAYVYFESEPGRRAAAKLMTKDEARKIANGIAKLPSCCDQAKNKSPLYAARLNGGRIGGLGQRLPVTSNNSDTGCLVPEKLAECEAFPPSLGARPALRRLPRSPPV